jgi:hypothetical protein
MVELKGQQLRAMRGARGRFASAARTVAVDLPRRLPQTAWALLAYLVATFLIFGLPVWRHLGSEVATPPGFGDTSAYIWFLAWWPHAILHGLNPFITHAIFVPEGYNLTWVTPVPGPALVLAPVTLVFGPTVAFNAFLLLAPALNAWAAFALCRYVTHAFWPSLLAGYVFGFSAHTLAVLIDPNLGFTALLPVFALLVIKRLDGSLSPRRFVVFMALAGGFQFLTHAEILASAALFGGFAMLAAYARFADYRARLVHTVKLIAVAVGIVVLVLSPYFYFMLKAHTTPLQAMPNINVVDPVAFFVPSDFQLGGVWQSQQWQKVGIGYLVGTPGYVGVPMVLIVLAFALERWRDRIAQLTLLCLLASAIASLGPRLLIAGESTVTLPWAFFIHLPLLRFAVPQRFAAFTFLAVALVLAMWLSSRRSVLRWGLALLAVASVLPNLGRVAQHSSARDPAFFRDGDYKSQLSRDDRVLAIAAVADGERWQARAGFRFKLAGGYVGAFPRSYTRYPIWNSITGGKLGASGPRELRAFIAAKRVTAVVVDKRYPGPWRQLVDSLGVHPRDTGGVLLYRLAPPGGRAAVTAG